MKFKVGNEAIYVIGGGVAAFYTGYRLKVPVIAKPSASKKYGPRYLHAKRKVGEILHELGFNSRKINVKVSYYYRDKIYFSATPEMVREYYSKCYSMLPYEKVELYKSVLPIFITTFEELEKKLKANVEIIPEEIISIDMKNNQLITANDVYDYDVLINTIPLPVFCYLAKLNLDYLFIYKPLWIYEKPSNEEDKILHFMDFSDPRTRINYREGKAFEERLFPLKEKGCSIYIEYGKICSGISKREILTLQSFLNKSGVYCIGRFARWEAHYNFEDVIDDIEKLKLRREE